MPARTSETDEKAQKERYLRAIGAVGTLTAGCKAAKVSPNTVYKWREHDEEFTFREQQARESCADELEASVIRRAKGRSDVLAMFMLKAMRPEKYRENRSIEVSGPNGNPIQYQDVSKLDDDELDALIAELTARDQALASSSVTGAARASADMDTVAGTTDSGICE